MSLNKNFMQLAGEAIEDKLPDNYTFILLVAPIGPGGDGSRLFYTSTMERTCAINVMKEFLIKASGEEEWLKHIK